MATINFPANRGQCNPVIGAPGNTDALQNNDTTNITADGVTITYQYKTQDNDHWWKSMGRVNNATPIDRIEEGNSSVEVVDTGANGQVITTTEGSSRMIVNSAGNVLIGGTLPGTPNIQLSANGKGEFLNDVEVGDRNSASGNFIWNFLNAAGDNPQLVIRCKNSAKDTSRPFVLGTHNNTQAISFHPNGAADFEGNVTIGGANNRQIQLFAGGVVEIDRAAGDGNGNVFRTDLDGTRTITFLANGSADFAGKITLAAAGKPDGIQFGSTNSGGNITSQTLDDYEEGTWTPTPGGTATFNTQVGTYTKIGRQVTAVFDIHINTIGDGDLRRLITLPFAANGRSSGSIGSFQDIANDVNSLVCFIDTGEPSAIRLMAQNDANGGDRNRQIDIFQDGAIVRGSITYFTNE